STAQLHSTYHTCPRRNGPVTVGRWVELWEMPSEQPTPASLLQRNSFHCPNCAASARHLHLLREHLKSWSICQQPWCIRKVCPCRSPRQWAERNPSRTNGSTMVTTWLTAGESAARRLPR